MIDHAVRQRSGTLSRIRVREIERDIDKVQRRLLKRSGQSTAASKAAATAVVILAAASTEFEQRNLLKSATLLYGAANLLRRVKAWPNLQQDIKDIPPLFGC